MARKKSIVVRRATLRDLDHLVKQRHAMHEEMRHRTRAEHEGGDSAYRKFIIEMTKKRRYVAFLAFESNNLADPIGGGAVWLREAQPRPARKQVLRIPYLLSVYTDPKHRGKGVASTVVKEAMHWARTNRYPSMTLHASEMGRKIYSGLGWRNTSEMRVLL
jgi:GNAT superfamily N-acetyltransferase